MLLKKLQLLGGAAEWDSCGGTKQVAFRKAGIPAAYSKFVHDCSQTSENCRLMKVLQSNKCIHDCRYCINSSCKHKKTELKPSEITKAFGFLVKKGFVSGLFLSSAVTKNADFTAEKMIESARLIREKLHFKGYIHLKVLPSMSRDKLKQMSKFADRLSLNIEAPSKAHFSELGSTKHYHTDLEKRLKWIDGVKGKGKLKSFTTQLIVGAASESDLNVLKKMNELYSSTSLHRTYFSAFEPLKGTPLENQRAEHSIREHRLYQADWLMRVYGFNLSEIKRGLNEQKMFSLSEDPKMKIAVNSPNCFPIEPNDANRKELMKVPGIGPKSTENILGTRKKKKFKELRELKECGVILKRAAPFLQLEKEKQSRLEEFC